MKSKKNMIKRIVDVCMIVILLCLMAYQVTGEELHERLRGTIFMIGGYYGDNS